MNIAAIQYPCFNPYTLPTVEIFIQGCRRSCCNCHNPELASFDAGEPINIEELIKYLLTFSEWFDIISITGGDLLCQPADEIEQLILKLRESFPDKQLWLFTGEDCIENIPTLVWSVFDVVKMGRYNASLSSNGFPASSNQRVLKKGVDY